MSPKPRSTHQGRAGTVYHLCLGPRHLTNPVSRSQGDALSRPDPHRKLAALGQQYTVRGLWLSSTRFAPRTKPCRNRSLAAFENAGCSALALLVHFKAGSAYRLSCAGAVLRRHALLVMLQGGGKSEVSFECRSPLHFSLFTCGQSQSVFLIPSERLPIFLFGVQHTRFTGRGLIAQACGSAHYVAVCSM